MCNVEVAQVRADPLKIISLSRDLFFSFVPGLLSRAGRSPAAQAAQPGPARLAGGAGGGQIQILAVSSKKKQKASKAGGAASPKRSTGGAGGGGRA